MLNAIDAIIRPFRSRFRWKVTDAGNSLFPDADLRTYYELRGIRDILRRRDGAMGRVPAACEIGCGYGRITPVLGEFADKVVGFEREPELISMAEVVVRDVEFVRLERLQDVEKHGGLISL